MTKPFIFTLFGSTGDLAQKKIMPALFKLFREKRLPPQFAIIAFSRRPWDEIMFRDFLRPFLADMPEREDFLKQVTYSDGTFHDLAAYTKLQNLIQKKEQAMGPSEKLFYLAVQPEFYETITSGLADAHSLENIMSRIMVEKPFGQSEASAKKLEATFEKSIKPEQLLRVDHYLAKEGIRIMVEQKQKAAHLASLLNNKHVISVHARIFEAIGIEGRGDFYEPIGALLDVGQNHLLEMLASFLADPQAKNHFQARAEALRSLKVTGVPVLGQYEGYLKEKEVSPASHTETYFKLTLESSLPVWKNVPFIIEAGKAMAEKKADIVVKLKDTTEIVFDIQASPQGRDAYEILLEEATKCKHDYFASLEEVLAAWHIVDPVIAKRATLELKKYPPGTNGPTS